MNTYGWHVVNVLPQEGTPGWSFTIGFHHSFGHPELVVFGLAAELAHPVLNNVGEDIRRGQVYETEHEYSEILGGVLCMFRSVQQRWYKPFLGYALWFYGHSAFPALQLIWPDKSQRFPWQQGFNPQWAHAQPLLFESDTQAANAEALLRTLGGEYPAA